MASSSYLALKVLFWKPLTIVTKTNGLTLPMHNFLSQATDDVNDL